MRPTAFKRKFAKVFEKGGFDAIVGNPPYLFITELSNLEKDYFQRRYTTTEYRFDIYGLFLERAVTELLKPGGRLGYIIPHTLLANDSFTKARKLLLTESYLHEVLDIGPGVFQRARNETMILVIERAAPGRRKTMVRVTTACGGAGQAGAAPRPWRTMSCTANSSGVAALVPDCSATGAPSGRPTHTPIT